MKRLLQCMMVGVMLCLLTACGPFRSLDDLYALPALPEEYARLQEEIQVVMDELDAEFAPISYGNYTSTIQLLDMDGDGFQEHAAVFLRVSSAEEKPLRLCLFSRADDDTYELDQMIGGDGLGINSVSYPDLTGDGVREVLVSWQVSARVCMLTAYQMTSAGAVELMSTSCNESYLTVEMDGEPGAEVLVFQMAGSANEQNRAEYYRYQNSVMTMSSVAPLSAGIKTVSDVTEGILSDDVPCVYVSSAVEGGALTDILVLEEDGMRNVTRDSALGTSQITFRSYTSVVPTDIDRDGTLDVPLPVPAASMVEGIESGYHFIYWCSFDSNGGSTVQGVTYHSVTDGWYFAIPDHWVGKITVSRDDSGILRGERAVVFYYWPDTDTTTPQPFLTIYNLTGDNRHSRAKLPGRETLFSNSSTIYCALLNGGVWDCGLESGDLMSRFGLITEEWSTD